MIFSDILELIRFLEEQSPSEGYLFRGQIKRFPSHKWKIAGENCEVEAIYPADFRFVYEHNQPSENLYRKVQAVRAYSREVRNQFLLFMCRLYLQSQGDLKKTIWMLPEVLLPDTALAAQDAPFFRKVWSLAQHYLVATALTDLTFDPRVAAWFATHPWDSEAPEPEVGEIGVIYRVHQARMKQLLAEETLEMRMRAFSQNIALPPELFLVDIRDIPEEFAKRPTAQQGASLYGFDQPHLVEKAFRTGAIEAFEFRHKKNMDVGKTRTEVIPEEDPFLPVLEDFHSLQDFLTPKTTISPAVGTLKGINILDRVRTAAQIPLTAGRLLERIELTNRFMAYVFDEIQALGSIRYKYMLVVMDEANGGIACIISVEPLDHPAENQFLPSEILGMWSGRGRQAITIGSWQSIDVFKERAIPIAQQVIASIHN